MWLNLRKFFILAQISPKKVPNHNPKPYPLKKEEAEYSLWHLFLGDLSQSEKLSEIKPPLKGRVAPSSAMNCGDSYSKMSIKRPFLLNGLVLNFL